MIPVVEPQCAGGVLGGDALGSGKEPLSKSQIYAGVMADPRELGPFIFRSQLLPPPHFLKDDFFFLNFEPKPPATAKLSKI